MTNSKQMNNTKDFLREGEFLWEDWGDPPHINYSIFCDKGEWLGAVWTGTLHPTARLISREKQKLRDIEMLRYRLPKRHHKSI